IEEADRGRLRVPEPPELRPAGRRAAGRGSRAVAGRAARVPEHGTGPGGGRTGGGGAGRVTRARESRPCPARRWRVGPVTAGTPGSGGRWNLQKLCCSPFRGTPRVVRGHPPVVRGTPRMTRGHPPASRGQPPATRRTP